MSSIRLSIPKSVNAKIPSFFSDAIDPDDTVLDFHFIGDVPQPILVFSEIPGDLGDGRA